MNDKKPHKLVFNKNRESGVRYKHTVMKLHGDMKFEDPRTVFIEGKSKGVIQKQAEVSCTQAISPNNNRAKYRQRVIQKTGRETRLRFAQQTHTRLSNEREREPG